MKCKALSIRLEVMKIRMENAHTNPSSSLTATTSISPGKKEPLLSWCWDWTKKVVEQPGKADSSEHEVTAIATTEWQYRNILLQHLEY